MRTGLGYAGLFSALLLAPWLITWLGDPFWLSILTEIVIWSCFAASINFLFGYVGLLSFGQALYFGFGMYGVALGITELHLSFWPAFVLGPLSATVIAFLTGILAVRLTWHYFAIITVVFSLIMYFLALTFKSLTGGDDGINFSLPDIALGGSYKVSLTNATTQYFFMLIVVALCFWLIRIVMASAFGRSLIAIRDNDVRASLIGIHVYRLRLAAFVIAGFLAGVSGTLFALFGRYASASYMFYHVSGEGVVWAIVGGIGTILGPAIGTGIFILIREIVSSHWQHYALIVGAFAICIVIFAPEGIVGLWKKYVLKRGA
ncbi:LivM ABC-type branched-chain amino acid transport system, permease component [Burkholderiaceae bacterium]